MYAVWKRHQRDFAIPWWEHYVIMPGASTDYSYCGEHWNEGRVMKQAISVAFRRVGFRIRWFFVVNLVENLVDACNAAK